MTKYLHNYDHSYQQYFVFIAIHRMLALLLSACWYPDLSIWIEFMSCLSAVWQSN